MGELGGGGGFAGAIHAHQRHHGESFGLAMQSGRLAIERAGHLTPRNSEHVKAFFALRFVAVFDGGKNALRHWQAEVGADEGVLDFFKRVVIELGRAGNDAVNLLRQLGLCALKARLEFIEQAHLRSHG